MKGLGVLGFIALAVLGMVASKATSQEKQEAKEPKTMLAVLGATTRAPTQDEVKAYGLPFRVRAQGQVVVSIVEDGPAGEAGLVKGDVILALDDNDIYSQDDIADFLSVSKPGQEVTAKVRSPDADSVETVRVLLEGRKASDEEASPQLRWQFAGLGQLPKALELARAEKKKVIVGLSGAET